MNHFYELSTIVQICAKEEFEIARIVERRAILGRKSHMETLKYAV